MTPIGANQRAAHREWRKNHPVIRHITLAPMPGGAAVLLHAEF